jgi:hypothetical protein
MGGGRAAPPPSSLPPAAAATVAGVGRERIGDAGGRVLGGFGL